jgi:RNAse (barnase) inhibitor barstar
MTKSPGMVGSIKALFLSSSAGGVFHSANSALHEETKALAKEHKFSFFHLDGKQMDGKKQLFNQAATVMHLPEYFANNWDSFEECITDFEWLESAGFVIYFDHINHFQEHHSSELETFVEILIDACEYWTDEKRPMLVIMHGGKAPKGTKKLP